MTDIKKVVRWMDQPRDKVLIREPGNRTYGPPVDIAETAKIHWEYAVMSENVYTDLPSPSGLAPAGYSDACTPESTERMPLPQWKMWEHFPSAELSQEASNEGLAMEVWEKESSPPVIAVVFRGTQFTSWHDWKSNLRWFLRYVPFYHDQYTIVAGKVGREFVERLVRERPDDKEVRIVATGHSLGGGLAQHFAYSLPVVKGREGTPLYRVSEVYGFDPSPVTGWSSVDSGVRKINARGLKIDRAFEHGEVLAYVRLLLGYVNPPSAADPAIRQIRYNCMKCANVVKSHSMRLLACTLVDAAGQASLPHLYERFQCRD